MKKISVNEGMEILEKLEKPFNDVVDWHIAYFQEPDLKKQVLYRTIYESKRIAYEKLKKELFKHYE